MNLGNERSQRLNQATSLEIGGFLKSKSLHGERFARQDLFIPKTESSKWGNHWPMSYPMSLTEGANWQWHELTMSQH